MAANPITLQCQTYWMTVIATECELRQEADGQTRAWWWCPICEQWHDPKSFYEGDEEMLSDFAARMAPENNALNDG